MTYADLAFYHWNEEVKGLRGFNDTDNGEGFRGFGNVGAWDRRIRRAVRGSCGYMGAKRMEMKRDGWGETSMEAKGLLAQVEGWNEENRRPLRGPVVRPLGERNEEGDSKGYEDLIMRYTQRRASSRT